MTKKQLIEKIQTIPTNQLSVIELGKKTNKELEAIIEASEPDNTEEIEVIRELLDPKLRKVVMFKKDGEYFVKKEAIYYCSKAFDSKVLAFDHFDELCNCTQNIR